MYNEMLTKGKIKGNNIKNSKSMSCIYDYKQRIMGFMNNKKIYDLNKKVIAIATSQNHTQSQEKEYRANETTKYYVRNHEFYINNDKVGYVQERMKSNDYFLLVITTGILICTLALIFLIDIPYSGVPIMNIKDENGSWNAQGTIAVLDEKIQPGSKGSYDFIVKNEHNVELMYSFSIASLYNETKEVEIPLQFRLRMNNAIIESESWKTVDQLNYEEMIFLPNTENEFTLEWKWEYESGKDEKDTLFGKENGTISLILQLSAQVRE